MKSPKQIMKSVEDFQTSQIIITAVKFDLFTKLDGKYFSVKELTIKTKLSKRGLERLIDALEDISLLKSKLKKGIKYYSSTKLATKCFGVNGVLKNWVKHQATLYSIWNNLSLSVKSGKPALEKTHDIDVKSYALGLMESYLLSKNKIHNILKLQSPVLDVGGGTGHFLINAFLQKKSLKGFIIERNDISPLTKNQIKKFRLEKRLSVLSGNALSMNWPKKMKTILISNVLHGKTEIEVKKLIQKAFSSLDSTGKVVINEWIKGSHYDSSLFDLNMLLCSKGQVNTKSQIEKLAKNAGFINLKWKQFTHTNWILIASKE